MEIKLKYCPLCESPAIRKKKGEHELQLKDRLVITPVIVYWECEDCGEVFYPQRLQRLLCRTQFLV